ncbi:MAG: hypothetical protein PHS59_15590 [Paludibacter sp.]|nr:hypothetical protein [Paludibacter sp.]
MNKLILSITVTFIVLGSVFAQKEVYFNSSNPEDLKVESLKGVELQVSYDPMDIIDPSRYNSQEIPYYLGFFYEKRIASTMTLGYSAGLFGSRTKMPKYNYTYEYDSISGNTFISSNGVATYKQEYKLGLRIGIEPRWYWNFKKRAEQNKVRLNSGWFLSMPLNYEYVIYNSYKPNYLFSYSYQSYGYLTLKPTIGYRQSITKNIFLEGSFGYGMGLSAGSVNGNFATYFSHTEPELKIKAAYIFK